MFTGPAQTLEPIARTIARHILRKVSAEAQRRLAVQQELFHYTWHNPDAPAADIFAEMGPEAVKFMQMGALNVEHAAAVAALNGQTLADVLVESDWMPDQPFTLNPDGTVTIG
jgi:hypothetical protein